MADAIDFCRDHLNLPEFKDSEATSKFIRIIDRLFDICNSRNPFSGGYNAPFKPANEGWIKEFFISATSYLSNLSDLQGRKLVSSPRKTAFLGFIMNMKSFVHLFETLVKTEKLKYLLTYKCSQDHLELFFCALRSRLGGNNNPSSREFKHAYKRLLLHHEICGDKGNCLVQDETSILTFPKTTKTVHQNEKELYEKYDLVVDQNDHDYCAISNVPIVSEFQNAVTEYIGGFVVRMASKSLNCEMCSTAILEQHTNEKYALVHAKDRGGLIHINSSVKAVCEMSEIAVQKILKKNNNVPPKETGILPAISTSVLRNVLEKYN